MQVNIAGRAAAIAPGSADNLAAFAGVYQTHNLPEVAGKPADASFELSISVGADGMLPSCNSSLPPLLLKRSLCLETCQLAAKCSCVVAPCFISLRGEAHLSRAPSHTSRLKRVFISLTCVRRKLQCNTWQ